MKPGTLIQTAFICLTIVLAEYSAHAATYFVSTCGSNAWAGVQAGCAAPLGPKRTIQAAINAANHGDTVIVLPGVYVENIDMNGKAITLMSSAGPGGTVIDGGGSGPIVKMNSLEGPNTVIDGFTIRNSGNGIGQGAMIIALAAPTVRNCIFTENFTNGVGSAIHVTNGSPTIEDCQFINNSAHEAGAYAQNFGTLTMNRCTFINNTSTARGGAFALEDTTAQMNECHFEGNIAGNFGGAVLLVGNGAFQVTLNDCTFQSNQTNTSGGAISSVVRNLSITNCTFTGNSAVNHGGAIYSNTVTHLAEYRIDSCSFSGNSAGSDGGAIYISSFTPLQVHASTFTNNTANRGGAIRMGTGGPSHGPSHVSGCDFHANHAAEYGAAISSTVWGHIRLINSVVRNNTAPLGGSALSHRHEGTFDVINCTVYGNATGAFTNLLPESGWLPPGEVRILNSIIWNNGASPFHGKPLTVSYSNVQHGAPGVGNMNANPSFINPLIGNFRLSPLSPCIDAGHNWLLPQDVLDINGNGHTTELWPLDFDGNPRVTDNPNVESSGCGPIASVVDMGAFETAGKPHPAPIKLGDLNGDGVVDGVDLLLVVSAWGDCMDDCCPADLNLDGVIDGVDLLTILSNWG
jgi:predicted outer membrane repeat protein